MAGEGREGSEGSGSCGTEIGASGNRPYCGS